MGKTKGISTMVWPPQSPHLNPIELLWDELDRAIRKRYMTSVNNLRGALQEEWTKISSETLKKLINRMPRLCLCVIQKKGGHIDETKV